jgi:hypothetical protein
MIFFRKSTKTLWHMQEILKVFVFGRRYPFSEMIADQKIFNKAS